ncbi:hypothetical protein [Desulforhopalus sp. 52FAK]
MPSVFLIFISLTLFYTMEDYREQLKARLFQVEEELREIEKRIPAHSVKPPVMEDLFALEDEKEIIIKKLNLEDEK